MNILHRPVSTQVGHEKHVKAVWPTRFAVVKIFAIWALVLGAQLLMVRAINKGNWGEACFILLAMVGWPVERKLQALVERR